MQILASTTTEEICGAIVTVIFFAFIFGEDIIRELIKAMRVRWENKPRETGFASTKFCEGCGTECAKKAKHCAKCGSKL